MNFNKGEWKSEKLFDLPYLHLQDYYIVIVLIY